MRHLLLIALLLVACGTDPGEPTPSPTPIPPESACTDGTDNDGDGAIDCDDTDCATAPDLLGSCNNPDDLAIYVDFDANAEWNACVPGAPGQGCLMDVDCNTTCIQGNTGLSEPCSRCFAEMVACFIGNCASACSGANQGSQGCRDCVATNCGTAWDTCFGTMACPYEYGCRDTMDNDGDGDLDQQDTDCQ